MVRHVGLATKPAKIHEHHPGEMSMPIFSEHEAAFLSEQEFGRLATVDASGRPHIVPARFRHDLQADTIDIGGMRLTSSKKYRDVSCVSHVAFVVDRAEPGANQAIEIRGEAELVQQGGRNIREDFEPQMIRIHPQRVVSWGMPGQSAGQRMARDIPEGCNRQAGP